MSSAVYEGASASPPGGGTTAENGPMGGGEAENGLIGGGGVENGPPPRRRKKPHQFRGVKTFEIARGRFGSVLSFFLLIIKPFSYRPRFKDKALF